MVRALASHQCCPGSTPGVNAICGLSLLLVLSLALRGFSPGTPVFPSTQKLTLPNSNSIWNARTCLNEFIWTPRCFVGKQAIYIFFLWCTYNTERTQGSYKKLQPLFKGFSRTTLDFQGPSTRNIISQIVQKRTFPVYSNKTLRIELFASPTSLQFSVHLSLIDSYLFHRKEHFM